MKHRINSITATLLICGTLLAETLQAFSNLIGIGFVLNPVIGIFVWLTAYFVFATHSVSVFGVRKLASAFVSSVIEMIPFVSILPMWTLYVLSIIVLSRIEDRSRAHATL